MPSLDIAMDAHAFDCAEVCCQVLPELLDVYMPSLESNLVEIIAANLVPSLDIAMDSHAFDCAEVGCQVLPELLDV